VKKLDEDVIRVCGWVCSLLCVLIGSYFVWPHIHVALLGIAFFYFAVRIFNFSTFKEYAEDRKKLLHRLRG